MSKLTLAALVVASGVTAYSMGASGGNHAEKAAAKPQQNIVETAVSAGAFETLVTAVKTAGLAETLAGEGPFTVFAPTDEAFAKIPEADLKALLANKQQLSSVLTYHVVPGRVTAAEVAKLSEVKTVEGQMLTVSTSSGVRIGDARVVQADVEASNGVIHVIDTVLIPKG